jgi:hypothetical protein
MIALGSVSIADEVKTTEVDSVKQEPTKTTKTIVYYFHTTRRCASCKKIETYSTEAISTAFTEQLENGDIEFKMINTDEEENAHYNEDYQLYTKSLILSKVVGGQETKWVNLEKIWELLGDQEKFAKYVVHGIEDFIKAD